MYEGMHENYSHAMPRRAILHNIEPQDDRYSQEYQFEDQWLEYDETSQSMTHNILQQHWETVYDEMNDVCCSTKMERYYAKWYTHDDD